ncbi:RluA family pseudouridine synthase [Tumebacillus permanentifrigoris]|uniref:Pseudouridine synthase n=1 Tax=Tumebacillus permanentifrigoris TaxID=378543 RepID=A0A316D6P7_9BACL|nr:RluA family pseudouridine synthase [Tumebacillus permanentifrigoris]PWK10343.1 RluA family pseudouridine synthase [Tumebacillus permanentifrigoris]
MTETHSSPTRRWVEHTITEAEAGHTVEEILIDTLSISRRMIQKLTRSKGIQLNAKPAFLSKKVRVGDVVRAALTFTEEAGLEPMQMNLDIVFEDADLIVLNKPPFLLVHPTTPDQTGTLAHGLAYHYQEQGLSTKIRPVHRIDRDTSGLLVVAKTAFAHQHLDRQLRERELKREYLAFVDGTVSEERGVIDAPIGKDKLNPNLRAIRPQVGEFALTRYQVVERYELATLVHLELETGRTHQIRVHMTHLGHPLIGDRQYGRAGQSLLRRQALHASRLTLTHPTTGNEMRFDAPLPKDLANLQTYLKEGTA